MRDIEKFFAPDKSIGFYTNPEGGNNPQEQYVVKMTGPLEWDSETIEDAKNFSVPGEARRLAVSSISLFAAGDVVPVTISGEIIAPGRYGYEEVANKWTAAICLVKGSVSNPCERSLTLWVGGYFKNWPPNMNSPRDAYTILAKHRHDQP